MLKIVWVPGSDPPLLRLEGRIAGPWIEELERIWGTIKWTVPHPIVDLTQVILFTREGGHLLGQMLQDGAELQVAPLMKPAIDRIKLEFLKH
jgi:hypothetical protein